MYTIYFQMRTKILRTNQIKLQERIRTIVMRHYLITEANALYTELRCIVVDPRFGKPRWGRVANLTFGQNFSRKPHEHDRNFY